MKYANTTLTELMEELKQERMGFYVSDDGPDEDEYYGDPDFDIYPDIDGRVEGAIEELRGCRLSEADLSHIREFLTFRMSTSLLRETKSEPDRTWCNLILVCDDPDAVLRVFDVLKRALDLDPHCVSRSTEEAMLRRFAAKSHGDMLSPPIAERTEMLLIYNCKDRPRMDMDGGSSLRDKSRQKIEAYEIMWRTVCEYVRSNPHMALIVSGSEAAYRDALRPNSDLSSRICTRHIHLLPMSADEVMHQCLAELRASTFRLEEGFQEALTAYFPDAYRASELTGQEFINDLISKIYARYFCRNRDDYALTADCVPDDNPGVRSVESVLDRMNDLVGLSGVKEELRNIYTMKVAGLAESSTRYHMLFSGNPGTGKTTVARMCADLLYRMDVIRTNKLVVTKPCDLVSEWVGGTGSKAMDVIRRAYNGVLFIDEAYGIATMDRGDELLNVLIQEMEDNGDKLVVILSGYTEEMRSLLKANPGLAGRIGREIHFDDYTLPELVEIFLRMSKEAGFSLDPSARDELEDCIGALMTREFFSNARDVRNMLQDLKEVWSEDYFRAVTEKENLPEKIFLPRHFEKIMPPKKEVSIRDLVGLEVMKQKLEDFRRQATYQKFLREKGFADLTDFSMHMIFTGNPGTGKTTVAKLIADDLYSIGILKTNRLVVAARKDLISAYGETAKKTADLIRKASGGVLFIDEAYALADGRTGGPGREAIEVFLTAMEERKSDTVFIFAGYVDQMQEFLAMNPGIQSRIGYTFHFEDYSPAELTCMYAEKMRKSGFRVSSGALAKVREIMEYFRDVKYFGNGRFVNHVIQQTISRRANRDFTKQYQRITAQDIPSIKTLLETAPDHMHLYDPAQVTEQDRRRTAVHELGHAIVLVDTDPAQIPVSISIRNRAGSLGRVQLNPDTGNRTEQELLHHIAVLLGGKNAEKVCFGSHSTGCAEDYIRARRIAANMVEQYAMTSHGKDPDSILQAADELSLNVISRCQDRLDDLTELLLQQKELTGEAFVKALRK